MNSLWLKDKEGLYFDVGQMGIVVVVGGDNDRKPRPPPPFSFMLLFEFGHSLLNFNTILYTTITK